MRQHRYKVSVTWTGNRGTGTSGYRDDGREHVVSASGRPVIAASSDPVFRGDPACCEPATCFIAGSVNFPVRHEPVIVAL